MKTVIFTIQLTGIRGLTVAVNVKNGIRGQVNLARCRADLSAGDILCVAKASVAGLVITAKWGGYRQK